MQTNREDVGNRYLDIRLPVPRDAEHAAVVSKPFRNYYKNLAMAREELHTYFMTEPDHHFFIGTAEEGASDIEDPDSDGESTEVILSK
ncbi:hypothetical protein D3C85_1462740 [compost metagenome]